MKTQKLPKVRPGDKIYKLFDHNKVIVLGNKDKFVVKIKKIED